MRVVPSIARPTRWIDQDEGPAKFTGVFTQRDVRLAHRGSLVVADDPATRTVLTVTPRDDLHSAIRRLTEVNVDEIPVVAPDDPTRLLGLLDRREVVSAYFARIEAIRAHEPAAG